ncbi:MAG TPA: adenine deaminase [Flavipsychrobacter sp.]|nr:adenine deaminase [Flavipsychrobacter sp.]
MSAFTVSGQLIDLFERRIYPAAITVKDGIIEEIKEIEQAPDQYILPGFTDAHVHIESSMLVPTEFARLAVVHGTVATISDPHEIANVCGEEGINYMIDNASRTPFKFFFGAPSCVPATTFETAGATINAEGIERLMNDPDIWYLAEVMNYPGVLNKEPEVVAKIEAAKKAGKPVDGHAPGLKVEEAARYAAEGISTDHECFTLEEAVDKIKAGMKILIREGSAAKNYEALHSLLASHPSSVMFCSDDKHPDDLVLHHINELVRRSLQKGYDLFDVLNAACVHPVLHYKVPVGLLRVNDSADFVVVDNFENFKILKTYIQGQLVAENGKSLLAHEKIEGVNNFDADKKKVEDFRVSCKNASAGIRVIEAQDGQLITNELIWQGRNDGKDWLTDIDHDVLKIVVVNRYTKSAPVAIAFIKGIGLKKGALASTVAHDCHNIVAVGTNDKDICNAVNTLIDVKGGISVADGDRISHMPLPVGGLMSTDEGEKVAALYSELDRKAKELGTHLHSPFMTLSFMALLVIPSLKLSDKGLFSGKTFSFTSIEV